MQQPIATAAVKPDQDVSITWHSMSAEDVVHRLGTQVQAGLTSAEAARRLEQYGPNQLAEKPRATFLQLVLGQLNNFVVILLIVASLISAVLGEWVEAGAILAIVVLNAILGVVQESRAEEALAALKKMAAPEAQAMRDGHRVCDPGRAAGPRRYRLPGGRQLHPRGCAPGGGGQPAGRGGRPDRRIGPGDKNAPPSAWTRMPPWATARTPPSWARWSPTGAGSGVVVSTGMHTQLGMIADMLQSVEEEETPLQQRLDQLGKTLGWGALAVCGLVFIVGIVRALMGGSLTVAHIVDMFMIAVSLAIAAVPEGLPAIVTISLALGMREMVRRHALIRRLASVETLGSATVICSDKTGTLTQNAMTVTRLWVDGTLLEVTGSGYTPEGEFRVGRAEGGPPDHARPALTALWVGVLNNDAQLERA